MFSSGGRSRQHATLLAGCLVFFEPQVLKAAFFLSCLKSSSLRSALGSCLTAFFTHFVNAPGLLAPTQRHVPGLASTWPRISPMGFVGVWKLMYSSPANSGSSAVSTGSRNDAETATPSFLGSTGRVTMMGPA